MHDQIPIKRAFLWIFLSVIAFSGTATLGWLYYLHWIHIRQADKAYSIEVIAQSHSRGEGLGTEYFAEVLGLSKDRPSNLYAFNVNAAREKLARNPLIKKVSIETIKPNMLYIDYEIRSPFAYLGDYTNVAVDEEGIMMPFLPFFTPKNLPKIYFGESFQKLWGHQLSSEKFHLSRKLLNKLASFGLSVKSMDLSRIDSSSYGEKEIIIFIEDTLEKDHIFVISPMLIRLNPDSYEEALDNFNKLREHLAKQAFISDDNTIRQPLKIIDLRVDNLGFIMRAN